MRDGGNGIFVDLFMRELLEGAHSGMSAVTASAFFWFRGVAFNKRKGIDETMLTIMVM